MASSSDESNVMFLLKKKKKQSSRMIGRYDTPLARSRRDATEYRHACHVSSWETRRRGGQPATTEQPKRPKTASKMTWSPQLKALLEGIHDGTSPLSVLHGHEDSILKRIYQLHIPSWNDAVKLTTKTCSEIAFSPCAPVVFPDPKDRSVNMLPFVLGDITSLPEDLQEYYDLIMTCPLQDSELGKVLYLTVEEGWVEAGSTQRRGGLHIESPRYTLELRETPSHKHGRWDGIPGRIGWGRGVLVNDEFVGGLYMASTVRDTCQVFHALVDKEAVDTHGGLDHLAQLIPNQTHGYNMKANELVWMTDRTPHQVLPQTRSEYRQFFRLVTSSLSIWNSVHNTPNPKVPLPPHVLVVNKSRFANHHGDSSNDTNKEAKAEEDKK